MWRFLTFVAAWMVLLGQEVGRAQSPSDTSSEADTAPEGDSSDEAARVTYELGRAAFDAGDFEQALGHFRRAYELSPRVQLLFNIGTTADRLQRNEEALEALEEYLERAPDAPNADNVRGRVRILREAVEQDRQVEAALENAGAADQDQRRRRRLIGILSAVGAVVLGGVIAAIVVATRPKPEPYLEGDIGVQFTLSNRAFWTGAP